MICCKPCAFTKQSLITHTDNVIRYVEKLIGSGYHETVAKRLKKLNLDVSKEEVANYIILAAAFHDVGKAIQEYQRKFDSECNPIDPGETSFYLHELFSSVILARVLSDHIDDDLSILAILAVLNHLHAMRDYHKIRDILNPDLKYRSFNFSQKNIFLSELLFIEKSNSDKIANYLSERCRIDRVLISRSLTNKICLDEARHVIKLVRNAEEDSYKRPPMKGYVFFLLPVVIGDNIDAYHSRRNEKDKEVSNRRFFIDELIHALGGEQ